MLPTFPHITSRRDRINIATIQRMINAKAPMLEGISGHIIHEGDQTSLIRANGDVDPTKIEEHSAYAEYKRMPIREFLETLPSILNQIAEQFAEGRSKQVFSAITEATDRTGNVVDGRGKPFDEELMYETLEKMSHSFDEDGNWQPPSIVVPSHLYAEIIERDRSRTPKQKADYDKRLRRLIERKKAEYDSEQAGRILAG